MRIIPVIDLMRGVVVRGIGGRREEYRPIKSKIAVDARPATVARAFAERGYRDVYVADLDAIMESNPAFQDYKSLTANGLTLWLDAGIASATQGKQLFETEEIPLTCRIIVGLESMAPADSPDEAFSELLKMFGRDRLIFSLDMKAGQPLTNNLALQLKSPLEIANEVLSLGLQSMIVLDLAKVGEGEGVGTEALCRAIRERHPDVELIGGGGVRDQRDLNSLAAAGCNAALVASALHDGRL